MARINQENVKRASDTALKFTREIFHDGRLAFLKFISPKFWTNLFPVLAVGIDVEIRALKAGRASVCQRCETDG